jgi:hypothetical protein
MASTTCPACSSNRVSLVISSPAGNRYRCDTCRHGWRTGGRRVGVGARAKAPSTFPADHTLDAEAGAARFQALLDRYKIVGGQPEEAEITWRAEAAKLFAPGNIDTAPASIFHDLSDRTTVATTGRQVAYRKNWTTMGEEEATAVARRTTAHLLHGDGDLTSRIDDVLSGKGDIGMPGFKEAIVTKILAIAEPETFIPILTTKGKVAFLQHVWGERVDVPKDGLAANIVWSNALLTERVRGTFPDLLHAAHFLWWTRTEL